MNFEQLNKQQIDEVILSLHLNFGYSEAVVELQAEKVIELWSEPEGEECMELQLRLIDDGRVRLYDRILGEKHWVFVGEFASNISELFE